MKVGMKQWCVQELHNVKKKSASIDICGHLLNVIWIMHMEIATCIKCGVQEGPAQLSKTKWRTHRKCIAVDSDNVEKMLFWSRKLALSTCVQCICFCENNKKALLLECLSYYSKVTLYQKFRKKKKERYGSSGIEINVAIPQRERCNKKENHNVST